MADPVEEMKVQRRDPGNSDVIFLQPSFKDALWCQIHWDDPQV